MGCSISGGRIPVDAHDDHVQHTHCLAAEAVAKMAKDDAAERTGSEPDCIRAKGGEGPRGGGEAGEEQLVEHQSGGGAVDEEVMPLDDGAEDAGPQGGSRVAGRSTTALLTAVSFAGDVPRATLPAILRADYRT
jgi:hypothetical protein